MSNQWSRRSFLNTSLKGAAAVGALAWSTHGVKLTLAAFEETAVSEQIFVGAERNALKAVIDTLIPAGGKMPAASEIGGVNYIDALAREVPEYRNQVEESLETIGSISQRLYNEPFTSLSSEQRVAVLSEMESSVAPATFGALRAHVYEAYYTSPDVWKLIGYEFYSTHDSGLHMDPLNEDLLAPVRQMSSRYKEVD